MWTPLAAAGMIFAVRDFSYTRGTQGAVLSAAGRVSSDIVISLKNTPHDFYPTFPDNPRIGHVGPHPQWVEFDTWGQFFGLGVFPSIVLDDMRTRFRHCRGNRVAGVIARTDWEVISDNDVLDTLNLPNLLGFAALARDLDADLPALLSRYVASPIATALGAGLAEQRFALAGHEPAQVALRDALARSWELMSKTVFVLRHVFHEDCMFPDTLKKAFMMMLEIHGIADWDPAMAGALELSRAKLSEIFREKDEALELARSLDASVAEAAVTVPEPGGRQLRETFELQRWYVEGFRVCARACFATRWHLDGKSPSTHEQALAELREFDRFRAALAARLDGTRYPHLVYWLLDTARLASLSRDLAARLAAV